MSTATHEPAQADSATNGSDKPEGTAHGPDADTGKLFEVPRVAIAVDDTDPTVIKLTFSGAVELNRTNKRDADFYNRLKAGRTVDLEIEAHVGTTKTTHRRDSAVVQSKSLTVHSIDTA